jgi:predicted dehydrogenase
MRAVIIGFGNIARKHLAVFREFGVDVVASSNRSEQGNLFAKEQGIPSIYTNFIEMIETEKPDYILNSVSFDQIYDTTKELIPYKIPLLIEKPAGTSVSELDELILLQEKYKTRIQVALNRRHYSVIENAILDAGGLDNITSIHVEWSETPLKLLQQKGYSRQQVEKIIFGNSIHGIDMMTYFSRGVENFTCYTSDLGADFRWIMNVNGLSKKGTLLSFSSSWDNPVPWKMVITAKGSRYVFAPLEECLVYTEGVPEPREIKGNWYDKKYKSGFYNQMKNFLEKSNNSQMYDLKSTRNSMLIAEELYNGLVKNA